MLRLALRNVFRHRFRTAMTLAAIVFGVTGLILSGGFVQDTYHQLGEALIHSQTGHLQLSKPGFHGQGARSPEKYMVETPDLLKQSILRHEQVDDVMGRLRFSGLLSNGRSDLPVIGEGVEPDKEARLGNQIHITHGRQLSSRDANGIVVGQGLASSLKLKHGDQVTLLLNTAEGALNSMEFDVVGTFQSFSKEFDARAVRVPLSAAQELLGTNGANTLVVSLKETKDTADLANVLKTELDGERFEVQTWLELNDFYENTVALYERQFGVLQLIILMLVLLSVANALNMSIFERVGEFGTMMAVGNASNQVMRLVVTESVIVGLVGAGVGTAVGILLALAISAVGIPMPPPPNANMGYTAHIRLVPSAVGMAFCVGLVATVFASILPARRVSRIAVVDALRQNY